MGMTAEEGGERARGAEGDGGGEIKRVENFFSFPSPHPATPGIMCPPSSEYNEIEWGAGEGGDLEKKSWTTALSFVRPFQSCKVE